jgi:hypothetical protein
LPQHSHFRHGQHLLTGFSQLLSLLLLPPLLPEQAQAATIGLW